MKGFETHGDTDTMYRPKSWGDATTDHMIYGRVIFGRFSASASAPQSRWPL